MSAPFDFFNYRKKTLSAEKVSLVDIADAVGTPFYVYSTQAFLKPLQELKKNLKGVDHMICFAVKANSNLSVLRLLATAGAGMDIVSGGELFRASHAGVDPEKIVFSGVGKTPGEMADALARGIHSFNVESTAELAVLSSIAQQLGKRAKVALRFNPDVNPKTHPYISTGLKKNKFGISRTEVIEVAKNLSDFPGIDLKGLSIHIGSQLLSLAPIRDAFIKTRELIDQLTKILPEPIEFVDLGGGLGITYKNEKAPDIRKYCELILKHFGPAAKLKQPLRIMIEPGRLIAGNSGVLVTEILYRKERNNKDFLVVDAAMNDLMRPALYGSYHEIVPVEKASSKEPTKKVDIVGPVCETSDCFATDRLIPRNLDGGDLLAILSAGAYGFTMSHNYNTRPRIPEILVDGAKYRVIRERESYEDLIRGETLD